MKISEVKKKFKNSWVLAEVLKMDKFNQPIDVKPIFVSKNRDKVYDAIAKVQKSKLTATLYTGELPSNFLLDVNP